MYTLGHQGTPPPRISFGNFGAEWVLMHYKGLHTQISEFAQAPSRISDLKWQFIRGNAV